MATDKSNMLCILNILQEYSDEEHILSTKDIQSKMQSLYEKTVDRRTVYSAVAALEEFGYEISGFEDNGKGYYIVNRTFDPAEIKLLIDAVYSCEYISRKQTEELLTKLRSFLSACDRKKFNYTNIVAPSKKSPNPEVFLNIEILEEAINTGHKVSFTYCDYGLDKKLHARREEPYVVSPYLMSCEESKYYLALILDGHDDPSFYRIDMMKNIKILDEKITISKRNAKLGSLDKVVYAHVGEPVYVKLKCKNSVIRYVIERFGNDIFITDNKDGTFNADFKAAPGGLVYWAKQYLGDVEVIEPKSVRDEVIQNIKNNGYIS